MSVKQAKQWAEELNAGRAKGELAIDKRKSVEQLELTLEQLFFNYMERYAQGRCATWKEMEKDWRRWFGDWSKRKVSSISRLEVLTKLNKLGVERGKHAANKAHDLVRAVFGWGMKHGFVVGENPAIGVEKFKVRSRERFVQPDEFKEFMEAVELEDSVMRDFVKMCLFTGQRKTNVMQMRWDQINLDLGTWFIPVTKNGESQTVTLTETAIKVLAERQRDSEWVFPSPRLANTHLVEPKGAWRRILNRAGLSDLRIHDLRRTMGSYMAILNVNSPIIGKALGHKSITAAARYQRVNGGPVKLAMELATNAMLSHAGKAEEAEE